METMPLETRWQSGELVIKPLVVCIWVVDILDLVVCPGIDFSNIVAWNWKFERSFKRDGI